MRKRELLARIEELERKLAEAEARIVCVEARPWPTTVTTVPDPYPPGWWTPPLPYVTRTVPDGNTTIRYDHRDESTA